MVPRHSHEYGLQKVSAVQSKAQCGGQLTAKTSWLNTTVAPDQECTEDRLGHDVQDAVEHSLRVWRDDIATLGKSPRDRVEEPEEGGPCAHDDVSFRDIGSNGSCVLAAGPDKSPRNPEKSEASEHVITPLSPSSAMLL